MGLEPRHHRLEQRIAGGVAVPVVDRLEAVEVDEHQRGGGAVAFHIGERALELAIEAAPVEDVEQRIDVGARLQLGDLPFRLDQFGLEPFDLRQQQGGGRHRRMTAVRIIGLVRGHASELNCVDRPVFDLAAHMA